MIPLQIINKPSDDFIAIPTLKDLLVLHYTAGGSISGSEAALAIRDYINVHYMVSRSGKVYQYFPEKFYAYHTGTGLRDAKRSIGLEIDNWGHLTRKGNAFYSWAGTKVPWGRVIRLPKFRGYEYWEKLTPEQELIIPVLVNDILSRWPKMSVVTHAMIKATKLDFPPTYPLITDLLKCA